MWLFYFYPREEFNLNIREEISFAKTRRFKATMFACTYIYFNRIAAVLCNS